MDIVNNYMKFYAFKDKNIPSKPQATPLIVRYRKPSEAICSIIAPPPPPI